MTTQPSDTPETDAQAHLAQDFTTLVSVVMADFSRQLERQRDELAAALKDACSYVWQAHMDAQSGNDPERVQTNGKLLDRIDAALARIKEDK